MVLKVIGLTGASGMVGRHILELMGMQDIACRASSRMRPDNLRDKDTWYPLDLSRRHEFETLDKIFSETEALIHTGATIHVNLDGAWDPNILDVNVTSTRFLGEWAMTRGVPFVYLSGATAYAQLDTPKIGECATKTDGAAVGGLYGLSKYMGEMVLRELESHGLRLIVLRPSSIYGLGLPTNKLVSSWLAQAREGKVITVLPPVKSRINFVHAHDVARSVLLALEHNARGTFNIPGHTCDMLELAHSCVRVAGMGEVLSEDESSGEPSTRFDLDGTNANNCFGYHPTLSLEEGLRRMLG